MPDAQLRQALSLVLHEHPNSPAVQSAARDAEQHAARWFQSRGSLPIVNQEELPAAGIWLTARVGCPATIDRLASQQSSPPQIVLVDAPGGSQEPVDLFRAPATLNLPGREGSAIVLAAIVRPGEADAFLRWLGPFDWSGDQAAALEAIESIIQAHVEQWRPLWNPWGAGADELLPTGEITCGEAPRPG